MGRGGEEVWHCLRQWEFNDSEQATYQPQGTLCSQLLFQRKPGQFGTQCVAELGTLADNNCFTRASHAKPDFYVT